MPEEPFVKAFCIHTGLRANQQLKTEIKFWHVMLREEICTIHTSWVTYMLMQVEAHHTVLLSWHAPAPQPEQPNVAQPVLVVVGPRPHQHCRAMPPGSPPLDDKP